MYTTAKIYTKIMYSCIMYRDFFECCNYYNQRGNEYTFMCIAPTLS